MVLRREKDSTVLTTQVDHAHASGWIAEQLRPEFFDPGLRDEIVQLTIQHDDGWIEWERHPKRDPNGTPINFDEIDESEHADIWRRGVSMAVETISPFAGAVLARHAQSLSDNKPELAHELSAQIIELMARQFPDADPIVREWQLDRAFAVLRICDLLTLHPCAGWVETVTTPMIDANGQRRDVIIHTAGNWELELDYWPFKDEPLDVAIPITRVKNGNWDEAIARVLSGQRTEQLLSIRPATVRAH